MQGVLKSNFQMAHLQNFAKIKKKNYKVALI
jgi:hypothetical protein